MKRGSYASMAMTLAVTILLGPSSALPAGQEKKKHDDDAKSRDLGTIDQEKMKHDDDAKSGDVGAIDQAVRGKEALPKRGPMFFTTPAVKEAIADVEGDECKDVEGDGFLNVAAGYPEAAGLGSCEEVKAAGGCEEPMAKKYCCETCTFVAAADEEELLELGTEKITTTPAITTCADTHDACTAAYEADRKKNSQCSACSYRGIKPCLGYSETAWGKKCSYHGVCEYCLLDEPAYKCDCKYHDCNWQANKFCRDQGAKHCDLHKRTCVCDKDSQCTLSGKGKCTVNVEDCLALKTVHEWRQCARREEALSREQRSLLNGVCVECTADSHCTGSDKGFCMNGVCVECTADSHCTGSDKGFCNSLGKTPNQCDCFPSNATVILASGSSATMDSLKHGDMIQATDANGDVVYDEVSFYSYASLKESEFVKLRTNTGRSLQLTAGHHLPVGATCCEHLAVAGAVKVGTKVWALDKDSDTAAQEVVVSVEKVNAIGLHSPVLVNGGFPVVDGFVTSFSALPNVRRAAKWGPAVSAVCKYTGTCAFARTLVQLFDEAGFSGDNDFEIS